MHLCVCVCVKMMSSAPASKRTWRGQGTWQGWWCFTDSPSPPSTPLTILNRDSNITIVMLIVHSVVLASSSSLCCFVVVCATHYMACRQGKHNWISMASVKNHAYATPAAATNAVPHRWLRSFGLLAVPPSAVWCPTIALNAMKRGSCWVQMYRPKILHTL